jgi:hypothetical protein
MNNLEDIVQIALSAYDKSYIDERNRSHFELELRRLLMQTSSVKKEHTYTVNPPNLMGTWTTTQARTMGIPPTVTNKEILHG